MSYHRDQRRRKITNGVKYRLFKGNCYAIWFKTREHWLQQKSCTVRLFIYNQVGAITIKFGPQYCTTKCIKIDIVHFVKKLVQCHNYDVIINFAMNWDVLKQKLYIYVFYG